MNRSLEKEKSSWKHRESTDLVRDSGKGHKDRDHKHRSSKDKSSRVAAADDEGHHHHSKHRDGDDRRHRQYHRSSREYSQDHEKSYDETEREGSREPREKSHKREREGSRERREKSLDKDQSHDRERRERSYEREGSRVRVFERRRSSKRKERGDIVDEHDQKRTKVLEDKKERKRFEGNDVLNGAGREDKIEKRRFEDGEARDKEERKDKSRLELRMRKEDMEVDEEGRQGIFDEKAAKKEEDKPADSAATRSGSNANGGALGLQNMASRTLLDAQLPPSHSSPIKVSSITTNEKKEVNINRSHEVPGKSSTDGTASDVVKSGGLSLDALAKAKRALQMQKELSERLKKISSLNSGSPQVESKKGFKPSPSTVEILPTPVLPVTSDTNSTAGATPGSTILPDTASASKQPASGMPQLEGLTAQKYEAVKRAQELAARMGFRQDPEFAPLINMFPGQIPPEVSIQPKPSKVPILRLDALSREIDEHGNLVNVPKLNTLSTLKVNINKQKKEAFQILKPELDVDPEKNPHFDARMGIDKNKLLRPKKMTFQFVEEGKWSREAEIIKLKSQFGEAQAKEMRAKQAQLAKAKAEPDINPNLIEVSERVITKEKPKEPIPEVEWWDVPLLRSGSYGDVTDGYIAEDKLKMEKITIYVEHPRPIEPPVELTPPPPQPLKLTKKEQKKLRTQRRLAREKERQEMIRQGLVEPPKPKVKMSNLMKVLGSEATQDPTKLEMEIRSAAAEREQAHIDRNIARKLTPAERREKKERKLFDDPSILETIVSIYKINDLSHPQTRFKVDINAQENRLTGCAVIAESFSVLVVEGGGKSIKRYGKLLLKRIKWAEAVKSEDENDDEDLEKPINKCMLVWQGSAARPSFSRFSVHECRTEAAARKIFSDAGVPHYWDHALNFTEDQM